MALIDARGEIRVAYSIASLGVLALWVVEIQGDMLSWVKKWVIFLLKCKGKDGKEWGYGIVCLIDDKGDLYVASSIVDLGIFALWVVEIQGEISPLIGRKFQSSAQFSILGIVFMNRKVVLEGFLSKQKLE